MREVTEIGELQNLLSPAWKSGATVGLVPTMGFLHDGHLALARAARGENVTIVLSIYVNPTQFGPDEDFERYPRDLEQDRRLAQEAGADVLFVPNSEAIYPGGAAEQHVWIDPGVLAEHLCGASRPGHFRGVATVVGKLFHMVRPTRAYFGQKDGQQAAIISRMAIELAFGVEVRVLPTVRETDGLALSSRNVYLSPEERAQARALSAALSRAEAAWKAGERNAARLEHLAREHISHAAPLGRIDYVRVVDLAGLQPVVGEINSDVMLAVAVYFGRTRLIDNVVFRWSADHARLQ